MNILILAAGMGTRLKPLTEYIPKALVPIKGIPLIQRIAKRLLFSNVERRNVTLTVNVHHHADQMENFLSLLSKAWQTEIIISSERNRLLNTGGAVKKALQSLEKAGKVAYSEPLFVHNVDILSNLNIDAFCKGTADAAATLLVSKRKTKRYLVFNKDMVLVGWTNVDNKEVKSPFPEVLALAGKEEKAFEEKGLSLFAFSGIHLLNPVLFPEFQSWPEAFSIIDFYLASCEKHRILGRVMPETKILDVGKLDTLSTAEAFLSEIE